MGKGAQDIDGTDNIGKILYDACCAGIHDRELVPGVTVVWLTSVELEESRQEYWLSQGCRGWDSEVLAMTEGRDVKVERMTAEM